MTAADAFKNCVHCGLCLPRCPTYTELRDENDSPRGRIYLMQAVSEQRAAVSPAILRHLDMCLDCRACETACPSGVPYGAIYEQFRIEHDPAGRHPRPLRRRLLDWLCLKILPHPRRTRWLLLAARAAVAAGLADFVQHCGVSSTWLMGLRLVEDLEPAPRRPVEATPSEPAHAGAALFLGCVGESLLWRTNRATARVLAAHHVRAEAPRGQVCCGALHYHAGDVAEARRLARRNVDAFAAASDQPIVVTVAGCGLMLKDYGRLLADDPRYRAKAAAFAGRVADVTEYLVRRGVTAPPDGAPLRVTYHEACHLCHGQGIRNQPRELLRSIPGLELVELPESDWCCGAAGTYSLRQPEMAARLAERKLAHIDATGAKVVAAANAGCLLHLMQHARRTGRTLRLVHPVDLLDERGQPASGRLT